MTQTLVDVAKEIGNDPVDRRLAIDEAAARVITDPANSRIAAGMLAELIADEAAGTESGPSPSPSPRPTRPGSSSDGLARFVAAHAARAGRADRRRTPTTGSSTSGCARSTTATCCATRRPARSSSARSTSSSGSPAGCRETVEEAAELYALHVDAWRTCRARRRCSTPAPRSPQLSSCFLLDSPRDELEAIYERYGQVARLSKYAGGIGIAWTRVRSRGSLIRGTNGHSNGIVPWLRTLDASVAAVNQGGRRKGARLRLPRVLARRRRGVPGAAGQHRRGVPPYAQSQPGQLDPRRVHAPGRGRRASGRCSTPRRSRSWSTCGATTFDEAYRAAEAEGRFVKQIPAR